MMISTRGRYALRVLVDLAENREQGYIPMRDVARRQAISLKYLEQILPQLVKNRYIEGVHGRGGGYRLSRDPQDCRVGDILRITEGDLAPVACLECGAEPCSLAGACRTRSLWTGLQQVVSDYLDRFTLAELMQGADF